MVFKRKAGCVAVLGASPELLNVETKVKMTVVSSTAMQVTTVMQRGKSRIKNGTAATFDFLFAKMQVLD